MSNDRIMFEVGLVGPTGVGKTSLISSVFLAGQELLAGTGITVVADDGRTEALIADHAHALAGVVQAGQFVSTALRATSDVTDFRLRLDPGLPDGGVALHVKDYPGGWLDPKAREERPGIKGNWESVRGFMQRSSVLMVPVEATVLMEATTPRQLNAVPLLLRLHDTQQILRLWAKGRAEAPESPALVLFVPMKGETYLPHPDRSRELFERFRGTYAECIRAVREEAQHTEVEMLYLPVDTLGCVEREWVTWPRDNETGVRCEVEFRIVNHGERAIRGVDDLLTALCRTLVTARTRAERVHERQLAQEHSTARSYAERDRGLVGNFFRKADHIVAARIGRDALIRLTGQGAPPSPLKWLSGVGLGRAARDEQAADRIEGEHQRTLIALQNLQSVIDKLAARGYSDRVSRL